MPREVVIASQNIIHAPEDGDIILLLGITQMSILIPKNIDVVTLIYLFPLNGNIETDGTGNLPPFNTFIQGVVNPIIWVPSQGKWFMFV